MNAIVTFALKQRVLMFVLMVFAFVARRRRVHETQH